MKKSQYLPTIFWHLLFALIALFLALCVDAVEPETPKVHTIFQIDTGKHTGTAFFISPTQLLTAAHVFAKQPETGARLTLNGKLVAARVVKFDSKQDIAVLEVDEANADFLVLAKYGTLTTVGFNERGQVVRDRVAQARDKSENVCAPGMSGGPVLNEDGQVVGMIIKHDFASSKGGTWITADTLRAFIERK